MPTSKQAKRNGRDGAKTPLLLLDVIDNWLKEMRRMWPAKELEMEEIEHWHLDLRDFPQETIDQAFENWRRNGRKFPIYGDIIDLCIAYQPEPKHPTGCNAECKARHRNGYGEAPFEGMHDITFLNELVVRKIQKEKRTREQRFTDAEIEGLLDQLDKKRGRAPAWR